MKSQFFAGNQVSVVDHNAGTKPFVRVAVCNGDRQHRRARLLGNQRKSGFKAQQISVFAAGAFRKQSQNFPVTDDLYRSFDCGGITGTAGYRERLEPANNVF